MGLKIYYLLNRIIQSCKYNTQNRVLVYTTHTHSVLESAKVALSVLIRYTMKIYVTRHTCLFPFTLYITMYVL